MADNIAITVGSGTTVATEDVSGVHHQKVKIEFGGDGLATPVSASDPLPVTNSTLATGASTAANQTTIIGHVDGIETLLGTIDADTSNIATDSSTIAGDTTSIDGKITACNTGAVVLAAGSAAIGKLAANSGVDIGDVDVASIAAGDNNIGNVDIASALPAGTNAIGKLAANSGVDIGDVDVTSITSGSLNGPGSPTIDSYTHAAINLAAGADQVLVSSAPNKQIWVYGLGFTVNVAGTVSFQDEDNTAITGVMNIAASSGIALSPTGNFAMPIWKLATDKDLEVDVVTSELDGWIDYAVVSV